MLTVSNLSVQFGKRVLFDDVNLTFTNGNCYGIIGANGTGKTTFLKILSGKVEATSGNISLETGKRMSVLEQDHFAYDSFSVLETVIMGNKVLFDIKKEIETIYEKPDFSDADGVRVGELQAKFEELDGWNAESLAANLLSTLGILESNHQSLMADLDNKLKVKVLIAKALFGEPDVLIMDEPTNDLDFETISWLEDYLANYKNIVIVVSHDRHFLDAVCTHISDIDFGKINHYSGNYTFWYESSQLAIRQRAQQNKKSEEKAKELQEFIRRFSANVAKSKQATSRKKMLEKLKIEDIKPSNRRYPGIIFEQQRPIGDQVLKIENLSFSLPDEQTTLKDISFSLKKGDKTLIYSKNSKIPSHFYQIISNHTDEFKGNFEWGTTINSGYLPLDNAPYFNENLNLVDWLRQWATAEEEREEVYLRGFLGKMLFSGEEALKSSKVLSGGEKMRCMISKMMMAKPNFLILDEPTNHLDLESITTFNNSLIAFKGNLLLTTHDHEFAQSVCNRIIEIGTHGIIDKHLTFDEYMSDERIKSQRESIYKSND